MAPGDVKRVVDECNADLQWLHVNMPGWLQAFVHLDKVDPLVQFLLDMCSAGGDSDAVRREEARWALYVADIQKWVDKDLQTPLQAWKQPATWSDPDATGTYDADFESLKSHAANLQVWAAAIQSGLAGDAAAIDDYYSSLWYIALGAVAGIAGIVVAVATWETVVGGVAGIIAAVAGLGTVAVQIHDLMTLTYPEISPISTGSWPQPRFQ